MERDEEIEDADDDMSAQWNRFYESRPWRSLFGSKVKASGDTHFRFDHPSSLIMLWQDFPELLAGWPGSSLIESIQAEDVSQFFCQRNFAASNGL